jgi:hypothetical protein
VYRIAETALVPLGVSADAATADGAAEKRYDPTSLGSTIPMGNTYTTESSHGVVVVLVVGSH